MTLSESELKERINYIGASECAAALGVSRWKSMLQLWAEKTQNIDIEDLSNKIHIWVGNEMEEPIARRFAKESGLDVRRVNDAIIHKDYNFIRVHLDRKIVGEDSFLEIKTASAFKANEWAGGDEIPIDYYLQCMHGLAVTGYKKCYIACLIGNQEFIWKPIERDDDLIKQIIDKELYFWNEYVLKNQMPMTISYKDSDTLLKLFPEGLKSEVEFGHEVDAEIDSLEAMKAESKSLDAAIEKAENELKARLKENESGRTPCHIFTWKNQTRVGLDSKKIQADYPAVYKQCAKETKFRVFRISERKEK